MNPLILNGTVVAAPKSFKVGFADLDSEESTRNTTGYAERDRIRTDTRKCECEWGPLTFEEISTILKAIKPVNFPATYPDPEDGPNTTRTFYAGNKEAIAYDWNSGMWLGLQFNLIEV